MEKLKNGYINKQAIITILALFISLSACFADEFTKNEKEFEIVVTSSDSVVKIHVSNELKSIKPENQISYFWYASNRIFFNKGGYSGKLLEGKYSVYDKTGHLICLGSFNLGRKNKKWKYWDNVGNLMKQEPWKKGKLDGRVYEYTTTGQIKKKIRYDNGWKQGKEFVYMADTILINKYKHGKLITPKEKKVKEKKQDKIEKSKDGKKTFFLFKKKNHQDLKENMAKQKKEEPANKQKKDTKRLDKNKKSFKWPWKK